MRVGPRGASLGRVRVGRRDVSLGRVKVGRRDGRLASAQRAEELAVRRAPQALTPRGRSGILAQNRPLAASHPLGRSRAFVEIVARAARAATALQVKLRVRSSASSTRRAKASRSVRGQKVRGGALKADLLPDVRRAPQTGQRESVHGPASGPSRRGPSPSARSRAGSPRRVAPLPSLPMAQSPSGSRVRRVRPQAAASPGEGSSRPSDARKETGK